MNASANVPRVIAYAAWLTIHPGDTVAATTPKTVSKASKANSPPRPGMAMWSRLAWPHARAIALRRSCSCLVVRGVRDTVAGPDVADAATCFFPARQHVEPAKQERYDRRGEHPCRHPPVGRGQLDLAGRGRGERGLAHQPSDSEADPCCCARAEEDREECQDGRCRATPNRLGGHRGARSVGSGRVRGSGFREHVSHGRPTQRPRAHRHDHQQQQLSHQQALDHPFEPGQACAASPLRCREPGPVACDRHCGGQDQGEPDPRQQHARV